VKITAKGVLFGIGGLAAAVALSCCFSEDHYSAEVLYYEGTTERWHIGQPKSRNDCTAEAIAMYVRLNDEKPGRAFSWACMLTRDGGTFRVIAERGQQRAQWQLKHID
jgi:hypothetical protein